MTGEEARNFIRNLAPSGKTADRVWTSEGRELLINDLSDDFAISLVNDLKLESMKRKGIASGHPGNWKIKKEFVD